MINSDMPCYCSRSRDELTSNSIEVNS